MLIANSFHNNLMRLHEPDMNTGSEIQRILTSYRGKD